MACRNVHLHDLPVLVIAHVHVKRAVFDFAFQIADYDASERYSRSIIEQVSAVRVGICLLTIANVEKKLWRRTTRRVTLKGAAACNVPGTPLCMDRFLHKTLIHGGLCMKVTTLALIAAVAFPAVALAQGGGAGGSASGGSSGSAGMSSGGTTGGASPPTSPGASQNAPGQQMQNSGTPPSSRGDSRGASQYAPGQQMQDTTTGSATDPNSRIPEKR